MRIEYVFVVVVFQIKFYPLGSLISHTLLGDQHTIDYYEIFPPQTQRPFASFSSRVMSYFSVEE